METTQAVKDRLRAEHTDPRAGSSVVFTHGEDRVLMVTDPLSGATVTDRCLRERYAVERLGICGSFARGDHSAESDVDLLVTFTDTPTLYEFVNLKHHLEEILWARSGHFGLIQNGPKRSRL